ncbi:MAG TPA: AMP-binding protein [Gemmatimonadaceae bacterium]
MTDPLSLLPLAVAAGGGTIDEHETPQLVAAGFALLQRSAPLVRALSGRRAGILLPASSRFLVALAASEGRGAVLVNPLAASTEIAYQLADAHVGAVFTTAALAPRVPDGIVRVLLDEAPRSARVIANGGSAEVSLSTHGFRVAGEAGTAGRDEEAAVVYTSAMAGRPLGAVLSHRNLLANARSTVEAARLGPEDHALALLPFAHLFGLTVTANAPLLAGASVTTMERFHPLRAIEALEQRDITIVVGVPAIYLAMLAALERRDGRLQPRALRLCICGGAPLAAEVQERWLAATGVDLRQGYGLTEGGPVCLFNRVDEPNRPGTLGVPFPGVEVEIHEPGTTRAVPDGAEGEIAVRGDNVFRGYVSGGEDGLQLRDGWLATGDRGARGADGAVTFRGLIKPMFTRNGFNIYPREIERAIAAMPGVRAVRVRAIPEPSREHDIGVTVTGSVTEDEVRRWCEARLSGYKQPSEVEIDGG